MAEAVFRKVQIGKESTYGTEVAATLLLAVEEGAGNLTLNRGTNVPAEDYGRLSRNNTGRGSHGIRIATGQVSAVATYQQLPHYLQMALGAAATTGVGPYTHVFAADETSSTVKSYTWEINGDTADWTATGVVIPSFELGFDALEAGENSPWMFSGDLQANDLLQQDATAAISDPTALETMEGHLTTISAGDTSTAFASLTALTGSLVQYSVRVDAPKKPRPYGGTSDKFTSIGANRRLCTVNFLLAFTSANIDATYDFFNVTGSVPTERRVRIAVDGSGNFSATLDHQLLIKDVHEEEGRDGERLLAVTAETTYNSTLAADFTPTVINDTASY